MADDCNGMIRDVNMALGCYGVSSDTATAERERVECTPSPWRGEERAEERLRGIADGMHAFIARRREE